MWFVDEKNSQKTGIRDFAFLDSVNIPKRFQLGFVRRGKETTPLAHRLPALLVTREERGALLVTDLRTPSVNSHATSTASLPSPNDV